METSIYNIGGGSGDTSYIDGGALVDADMMLLNNNTYYTYNAEGKSEINFYFESDDEILNSVVDLKTDSSTKIGVYIKNGDLLYTLGNIYSNNVNSGSYRIQIIGRSYSIEEIINDDGKASYLSLDGLLYPMVKIGGLIWTAKDVNISPEGIHVDKRHVTSVYPSWLYDNTLENTVKIKDYIAGKNNGFRVPTYDDFNSFRTDVNDDIDTVVKSGFASFPNATNSLGFSAIPAGYYNFGTIMSRGSQCSYLVDDSLDLMNCHFDINPGGFSMTQNFLGAICLRLCKNA